MQNETDNRSTKLSWTRSVDRSLPALIRRFPLQATDQWSFQRSKHSCCLVLMCCVRVMILRSNRPVMMEKAYLKSACLVSVMIITSEEWSMHGKHVISNMTVASPYKVRKWHFRFMLLVCRKKILVPLEPWPKLTNHWRWSISFAVVAHVNAREVAVARKDRRGRAAACTAG